MGQFYAGRKITDITPNSISRANERAEAAERLHNSGASIKHKDGIDLSYIYSLSALTPRQGTGTKLTNEERRKQKEQLREGVHYTPRESEQIRAAMQESSWLYGQLSHMTVKEISGQAYSLGERKLYSGRTPNARFRRSLGVKGSPYELQETDTFVNLPWRDFAVIANLTSPEEFEALLAGFFHEALALDTLRIGFNGRFCVPSTDPDTWPMGEDVNKGWHEVAKEYNGGSQVLTDNIQLGPGGDFAGVDTLADHLIKTRLPKSMQEHPGLVVLVGAELARKERLRLFDGSVRAADAVAAQSGLERVAGRFAIVPPFMPANRLVVTTLSNLHVYTKEESEFYREGFLNDNSEYFWSLLRMEGYGLEDCAMYAAADEGAVSLTY